MTISIRERKLTANKDMLNTISMWCIEAGRMYEADGYSALANEAFEFGITIYEELKKRGCYDTIN